MRDVVWISGVVLLSSVGCAAPALEWRWAAPETLVVPPEAEDDAAVFLLKEVRYMVVMRWDGTDPYMERQHHDVLAILTEKGFEHADVRVVYPEKGEIRHFAARTIAPDGAVTAVEPSRVIDDKVKFGDVGGAKVRVFAFPGVQVGSILEYNYTIRIPRVPWYESYYASSVLPVKRYNLELMGTKDVKYSIKAYNSVPGYRWHQDENGRAWKVSWSMDNIPPTPSEDFAIPRSFRDPWWAFTVVQLATLGRVAPYNEDWNASMTATGQKLYFEHGNYYDGFAPEISYDECEEPTCKIERALAYLRRQAPLSTPGSFPGRDAKVVLAAGEATGIEKARLLWAILRDVGISAQFAFYKPPLAGLLDTDLPSSGAVPEALLHLPVQDGITEPLWIDPSCEYCAVGELPSKLMDARALLVQPHRKNLARVPDIRADFIPVTGKQAPAERYSVTYQLRLSEEGDLAGEMVTEWVGRQAQVVGGRTRRWKGDAWKKDADQHVKWRIPNGVVVSDTTIVATEDARAARRVIELSAPAYATVSGDALIVPSSVLRSSWDDYFKEPKRKTDVAFLHPVHDEEVLLLQPPPGYVVDTLPESVHLETPMLDVKMRATVREDGRVELTRGVYAEAGHYDREGYAETREAVEAFRRVRRGGLTFRRVPAAVPPTAPPVAPRSPPDLAAQAGEPSSPQLP